MQSTTIPMYVSPSMSAALGQLGVMLEEYRYSPRARAEILAYVAREGTTAGCPILDPEDHQDAEQALEESFTPVDSDSPAWDKGDVFLDASMLADGSHPFPIPAIGDEDDRLAPDDEWPNLEALGLARISGGAPSEEDSQWWAEQADAPTPVDRVEPARDPLGACASPCGSMD